jgi:hypothetical protein
LWLLVGARTENETRAKAQQSGQTHHAPHGSSSRKRNASEPSLETAEMELEQVDWTDGSEPPPALGDVAAPPLDSWCSNVLEGLKEWVDSPTESLSDYAAEHGEALSVIDSAFLAVHSALKLYA